MKFGEFVRSLREASGLKQHELANRVGISASMLSLLESGKREPTIRMLSQLARGLDTPAALLFAAAMADVQHTQPSSELRGITRGLEELSLHVAKAARRRRKSGRK